MTRSEAVRMLVKCRVLADYVAAQGYQADLSDPYAVLLDEYRQIEQAYQNEELAFDVLCSEAGLRPSDIGLLHAAAQERAHDKET